MSLPHDTAKENLEYLGMLLAVVARSSKELAETYPDYKDAIQTAGEDARRGSDVFTHLAEHLTSEQS